MRRTVTLTEMAVLRSPFSSDRNMIFLQEFGKFCCLNERETEADRSMRCRRRRRRTRTRAFEV